MVDVSETEATVDVMGVLGRMGGFGDKFNLGNKREFQTGAARPLIKTFFQLKHFKLLPF